jgi:hypothetical protein
MKGPCKILGATPHGDLVLVAAVLEAPYKGYSTLQFLVLSIRIFFCSCLLSQTAQGASLIYDSQIDRKYNSDPISAKIYVESDPPEFLFHWTTLKGAEGIATNGLGYQGNPSFYNSSALAIRGSKPLLYTWTHPIDAVSAGLGEQYGGEVLVALKLNKEYINAVRIDVQATRENSPSLPETSDIESRFREITQDTNLVLHRRISLSGQVLHQEWIVLDPIVIKAMSADPQRLGPMLNRGLTQYRAKKHEVPSALRFQDWLGRSAHDDLKIRRSKADLISDKYIRGRWLLPSSLLTDIGIKTKFLDELYEHNGAAESKQSSWFEWLPTCVRALSK